jgi:hypothetical protein
MTAATEYKGSKVMAEPYDTSLMDSNRIHVSLDQNGGTTSKTVLEIGTVLMITDDSNFSWT